MVVLVTRVRSARSPAQSPCSPGHYPPSPLRQRAPTPGVEDRGHPEVKGHSSLERKSKSEAAEKKIPKSSSKELSAGEASSPHLRSAVSLNEANILFLPPPSLPLPPPLSPPPHRLSSHGDGPQPCRNHRCRGGVPTAGRETPSGSDTKGAGGERPAGGGEVCADGASRRFLPLSGRRS